MILTLAAMSSSVSDEAAPGTSNSRRCVFPKLTANRVRDPPTGTRLIGGSRGRRASVFAERRIDSLQQMSLASSGPNVASIRSRRQNRPRAGGSTKVISNLATRFVVTYWVTAVSRRRNKHPLSEWESGNLMFGPMPVAVRVWAGRRHARGGATTVSRAGRPA